MFCTTCFELTLFIINECSPTAYGMVHIKYTYLLYVRVYICDVNVCAEVRKFSWSRILFGINANGGNNHNLGYSLINLIKCRFTNFLQELILNAVVGTFY